MRNLILLRLMLLALVIMVGGCAGTVWDPRYPGTDSNREYPWMWMENREKLPEP